MYDVIDRVFVAMYVESRCSECGVEELVETGLVEICTPKIEQDMIFKIELGDEDLLEHVCGKERAPRKLGRIEKDVCEANRRMDKRVFDALTRMTAHLRKDEVAKYPECEADTAVMDTMLRQFSTWQGDAHERDIQILLEAEKGTFDSTPPGLFSR